MVFFKIIFVSMLGFMMVACSGQAEHTPRSGEYGKSLVNSIQLSNKQIEKLNAGKETVAIHFEGDYTGNPYRFVAVVWGVAENKGEVDVRFLGGVKSEFGSGFHPELFREEDDSTYLPGDNVLLIIPSEPFSIGKDNESSKFYIQADLTKRDNIKFEQIELQVWQGKGNKFSVIRYLWLFTVIAGFLLFMYRGMRVLNPNR